MKIQITNSLNEIDICYVVYVMIDPTTNEIEFVGHCKLVDIFKTPDVRGVPGFDKNKQYRIEYISAHNNAVSARYEASRYMNQVGRPKLNVAISTTRHCMIECVETGERWQNAAQCASQQGINGSALSNHLNNKPGFVKVRGLTYRRIPLARPDLRRQEEAPHIHPWVATADPVTLKVEVWQGESQSRNVIATGDEKNVKFKAYMWIVNNSTPDHASTFAADHGVY